jgi:hypothetical protein
MFGWSGRHQWRSQRRHLVAAQAAVIVVIVVVVIALVAGLITGALVAMVASIAAYRIVFGDAAASLGFAPITAVVWDIAAYRAARRDDLWAGPLSVLVAGLIAAIIGSLAEAILPTPSLTPVCAITNAALPSGSPDTVIAYDPLSREPDVIYMMSRHEPTFVMTVSKQCLHSSTSEGTS